MKANHRRNMRSKTVIALIHQLVAIRNNLITLRIDPRIIKQRLSAHLVPIRPSNRHRLAKAIPIRVICAAPTLRPQIVLLPLPRQPILHALVQRGRRLVINRSARKNVLVLLRSLVRNMIEVPCIRNPRRIHAVMNSPSNLRRP